LPISPAFGPIIMDIGIFSPLVYVEDMFLEKLSVGPFQCNCSILACEKTQEAIIIDPGEDSERILSIVAKNGLKPKYLLHTHAHLDHVGATEEVCQRTKAEVCLHPGDQFLYDNVAMQAALFNLPSFTVPPVNHELSDRDTFKFGEYKMEVLHTPGHTPGSCSFLLDAEGGPQLFTGDTLFLGSIGRTDLWGGDYEQILQSIKAKLLPLADNTVVHAGHGPNSNIGRERKGNPFLVGL